MATVLEPTPVFEAITEQLVRISQSYKDDSLAIQTTPNPQLRAELAANTALIYARLIPSALGVLETWTKNAEERMRKGMNKDCFRVLVANGVKILGMCQEMIETANNACQNAESLGESSEAKEARQIIAEAQPQLQTLQSKTLSWKKIADRQPPEIDLALIEKGMEEIRQGKFKTAEQILEELRDKRM
jgi:hypothetical protein